MKLTYNLKNSIFDSFSDPFSSTKVSNNSSFMASFVTKRYGGIIITFCRLLTIT